MTLAPAIIASANIASATIAHANIASATIAHAIIAPAIIGVSARVPIVAPATNVKSLLGFVFSVITSLL